MNQKYCSIKMWELKNQMLDTMAPFLYAGSEYVATQGERT